MSSFYLQMRDFTVKLNVASARGWHFGADLNLQTSTNSPLGKVQVIEQMHQRLASLPLMYTHRDASESFSKALNTYTATATPQESLGLGQTLRKIQKLLIEKMAASDGPFQTPIIKELERVLSKKTEDLETSEWRMLYEAAHGLATIYMDLHALYLGVAIHGVDYPDRHKEIGPLCRHIKFTHIPKAQVKGNEKAITLIEYHTIFCVPDDLETLNLLLSSLDTSRLTPETRSALLETLIKKQAETNDPELKEFIDSHVYYLGAQIVVRDLQQPYNDLNKRREEFHNAPLVQENRENIELHRWTSSLLPHEYLHSSATDSYISFSQKKDLVSFAMRTHDHMQQMDLTTRNLYRAISEKVTGDTKNREALAIPFMPLDEFLGLLKFVTTADFFEPMMQRIAEAKKQAAACSSTTPIDPELKSLAEAQTERSTAWVAEREKAAEQSSKPVKSLPRKIPLKSTPKRNPPAERFPGFTPDDSYLIEILEQEKAQRKKPTPSLPAVGPSSIIQFSTDSPRLSHTALKNASIFNVHQRITDWFLDHKLPASINQESPLFHNFAWASNDILWRFGKRHLRQNSAGAYEPAIAMLCKVHHPLYPTPRLLLANVTFSEELQSQPQEFNPSWTCYHRGLTYRVQDPARVTDCQSIHEFLALRATQNNPETHAHDLPLARPSPDGSYIEAVAGTRIIVRDPKHDQGEALCRFEFLIPPK